MDPIFHKSKLFCPKSSFLEYFIYICTKNSDMFLWLANLSLATINYYDNCRFSF